MHFFHHFKVISHFKSFFFMSILLMLYTLTMEWCFQNHWQSCLTVICRVVFDGKMTNINGVAITAISYLPLLFIDLSLHYWFIGQHMIILTWNDKTCSIIFNWICTFISTIYKTRHIETSIKKEIKYHVIIHALIHHDTSLSI